MTTLVSRYMRLNPEVSLDEARGRVRERFGIPIETDLGSGLGDTWRSPFSWSEFIAAAGETPLDT